MRHTCDKQGISHVKIDKNNGSHVKTSIFTCETHAVHMRITYEIAVNSTCDVLPYRM